MLGVGLLLVLLAGTARAWDFTYCYRTVNDAEADAYLVDKQHARKVHEWTAGCYWGPEVNDEQATVTYRFRFPAPSTEAFLHTGLTLFNYAVDNAGRTDYGSASLWASTDGTSWHLLLDGPTPAEVTSTNLVYHQRLPAWLLGSTNLWIQARMQQHNAMLYFPTPAATWTDAQFSRGAIGDTNQAFELKVNFNAPQQAQASPQIHGDGWRWRVGLIAAGAFVGGGVLFLLLVCMALLCLLVRRSGQQLASNTEVLRRLDQVIRHLEREPGPLPPSAGGRHD